MCKCPLANVLPSRYTSHTCKYRNQTGDLLLSVALKYPESKDIRKRAIHGWKDEVWEGEFMVMDIGNVH
jgi:hypothetical protein